MLHPPNAHRAEIKNGENDAGVLMLIEPVQKSYPICMLGDEIGTLPISSHT